jgi:acetoin utilization protein AcuC
VAIASSLARHPTRKVAYIDIDVHHGDGVMYGFYGDGHVLDIDFHQDGRTLFPGTGAVAEVGTGDGQGLKVNIPFSPGTGSNGFRTAFRRVVPTLIRAYRPELIVLQGGVDGHVGDPLAQLRYTPADYHEAVSTVHALAHEVSGGRLLVTGGGGYRAENVSRILAQHAFTIAGEAEKGPPSGELPRSWRRKFRDRIGAEAPVAWGQSDDGGDLDEAESEIGTTLGELESCLGRPLRAE